MKTIVGLILGVELLVGGGAQAFDANARSCPVSLDSVERPHVIHFVLFQPLRLVAGYIGRAVIAEQPRLVHDLGTVKA